MTTLSKCDDKFLTLYRKKQQRQTHFCCIARSDNDCWLQWAHEILPAATTLFYWCGSTTSTIAKAQNASNKIDCNATMWTSTTGQSFLYVVLQVATTITTNVREEQVQLPHNNQKKYVVLCRMQQQPCCATWQPAAHVRWGWVRQVRQKQHANTLKTVCILSRASMARMPRRTHLSRRVTLSTLSKTAMMNPLPRKATGPGATMSLLPQGQLAIFFVQDNDGPLATNGLRAVNTVQGNNKPLTTIGDWAMTFDNCEGAKALRIKLIIPITIPYHCNEVPLHLQWS